MLSMMVSTKENSSIKEMSVELWNRFPDLVTVNKSLKNHNTYQVGGNAAALCIPRTMEELQEIVERCYQKDVPVFILGSGSNVLIHDDGLKKIVIKLEKCCSKLSHEGNNLYAGAGILISSLVQYCVENSLAGLDFMSGIPGTVGGALRMNAGAFLGEIGDRVISVDLMDFNGNIEKINGDEAGFGYRRADFLQENILLGCSLQMSPGNRADLEKHRSEYLNKRSEKQPLDYGSCGSVFKRPPDNYAGALIEKAGCKGLQVGGAMVSKKHANFIINYNNAKASEIYELIQIVQQTVYDVFNIWLELEVKLLGFSHEEEKKVQKHP